MGFPGTRTSVVASLVVAAVASASLGSPSSALISVSGCETAAAPTLNNGVYEIASAANLQWIKDTNTAGALSNNYKLTQNIDMATCTWSDGIGAFGSPGTPYTGTFNGNSKTISNLTISGGSTQNLGLFDYLNGSVNDLTLASPSVSGTGWYLGSLAGQLGAVGAISGVTATSVSISGYYMAGGLVGRALSGSTVSSVTVSGTVTGDYGLGGVAGDSFGSITSANSSVNVTGGTYAGGLVGALYGAGQITNSTSTGNVTSTNSGAIGGAVGNAGGTRPTCPTLTGVVTSGNVAGDQWVGGVLGYGSCYYIYQSSSSASVVGDSTNTMGGVGGIVGSDLRGGRIEKSYFTGQVQGSHYVGGIAGKSYSIIKDSYSTGSVTAALSTYGGFAGGLIGRFDNGIYAGEPGAELVNSYASGLVTPPPTGSSLTTGGLIGQHLSGTITSSVWNKETSGRATSQGTGVKGYTSQQLRDYVLFNSDNLNWNITDGISSGDGITTGTVWSICSGANGGYPFLTRQGLSGTCRPTMAYNGNGNTGGTAPSDGSSPYTSGDTVSVVGNTGSLTRTSAVFTGWNTKANGTGTAYAAGDSFTITAPVMLFAQWLVTESIYYNPNGGTGLESPTTGSTGSTVTLSSGSGFTRDGYVLSRWDTASAGTGTSYSKGQSITMPAGGRALYAVWTSTATSTTTTVVSTTSTTAATTSTTAGSTSPPTTAASASGTTTTTVSAAVVGASPSTATTTSSSPTTTSAPGANSVKGGQSSAPTTSGPSTDPTIPTTTTTVIAPSTTEADDTVEVPDVEDVGPSEAGATLDGAPVDAVVSDDNGSIVVSVGQARLRYSVTDASGVRRLLVSASSVELQPGDVVNIELSGFAAKAQASVWLVPGDVGLGSATLDGGAGAITGVVPSDASPGLRRIVTASESVDGKPMVVAYGVDVTTTDDSGPTWSIVFLVIVGLAVMFGLFIPAARRRRDDSTD